MLPVCILAIEDESDRRFMEALFLRYERLMLSEARSALNGRDGAEDVMQATLVKLIDRIALLRTLNERSLVNYIITAVRHTAISELRRTGRELPFAINEEGDAPDPDADVEQAVLRGEQSEALADAWNDLDPKTRYLLEARYILGRDYTEIAEELGIRPESARMALSRARRRAMRRIAAPPAAT